MEKEEIVEKFAEFLREDYYNDLLTAVNEGKKSFSIDFSLLDRFDPELADYLLENPEEALALAEEAVRQIDLPGEPKLKIRFFNLPESKQIRIRNIRAEHINKLISVDGIVKRASEIRPEVSEAIFSCPECGKTITVIQTERLIRPPIECDCGNRKNFRLIDQKLYDARWVAIEEPFEITTGERPSEIMVFLKEDLTSPRIQNMTEPGNRIKVVGILKQLPRRVKGTRSRQMEIYVDANSVESVEVEWEELEITPEDEKKILELARDPEIYNKLVGSIAPALYGMDEIKEAIALQLFGGEVHIQKDKSRTRGDIHLLLVGDPSCLVADERVVLADGTMMRIGEMGSRHLQNIDYNLHLGMGRKAGKAKVFHIYRKQPIIEVVTETGKSIKGTYNQPILIVKNKQKLWKRLDEVKIGEKVQVVPKIECRKKTFVKTNWYPYHKKQKVPEFLEEDLASLFGYIIASGCVQDRRVSFIIKESDILPKIKNAFEKCFNAPVHEYKYTKVTYYQVNRTHVAKLLSFLNERRVPNLIFRSGNSVAASFLRWLYEGSGSVLSKGRMSVNLKSNNIELLRDVQTLLLRFGIHSRILWESKGTNSKSSLVIGRSESIIKFWRNVGFVSEKKKSKLEQVARYAKSHVRNHESRAEKIVKIDKLPPQDVFDIEVPKYRRFVANGIVVHNTAKSVLMKVVSTLIPRGRYVSGKGVTGAGLCTVYDTIVQLEDGSLVPIGKLVEDEIKNGSKKIKEGFVTTGSSKKVLSLDQNLKIKPLKITKYWKLKAPKKLIKIVTQTGKEVIVTPENPIPVIKNGKIIWRPAFKLNPGEYIATPRVCRANPKITSSINLLDEDALLLNRQWEVGIDDNLYYYWKHGAQIGGIKAISNKLGVKADQILPKKLALSELHGIPLLMNSNLAYLMGLIAGGSISKNDFGGFDIKSFNIHDDLLKTSESICERELNINPSHAENGIPYFRFNSKIFGELLNRYVVSGDKSHNLKVAEELSLLPKNILASYLQGVFDAGSVVERKTKGSCVELSSASKEFIRALQILLLRYGIISLAKEKKPRTSVIRNHAKSRYVLIISGLENLKLFRKNIGFRLRDKLEKLNRIIEKSFVIGNLLRKIRNSLGLSAKEFYGYKDYSYENGTRKPTRKFLRELLNEFGNIKELVKFANSDIFWDKIKKIEIENSRHEYVYDITVENGHSFVANGLIIHNTATVVRDEEFLGGWVLEAGALVMCNKSLIAIDEFEKIEKSDQIALHEAMEQNTISIAKANIVATLPAQTAILGGGNPKLGRFDPYLPIKEQIDIPETLLARFDLKFALRDIPNPEVDAKIADHILKVRHYGEEEIKPIIEADLLKKYVAYARKNCHPKLSREAGETIKDFFVRLREKVTSEEAPVPITLRQYEALIRLAEASAKVQLRDEVTKEDALRAINLMKASLRQFGFDPETGRIDIDRVEGHITAAERGKIRIMLDVIEELTKTIGKNVPKEDIVKLAKSRGLREFDIEKMLNELKNIGTLFEPRPGIFQKM
ncbi:MAG: LAGLIDADG family homing endonuclease [Candidatus Aenigmarchaeota archaeon]|nr:LAGLIDADG family homing endonuclease [Candidatus Aenigmarchaeota archaeon]